MHYNQGNGTQFIDPRAKPEHKNMPRK